MELCRIAHEIYGICELKKKCRNQLATRWAGPEDDRGKSGGHHSHKLLVIDLQNALREMREFSNYLFPISLSPHSHLSIAINVHFIHDFVHLAVAELLAHVRPGNRHFMLNNKI